MKIDIICTDIESSVALRQYVTEHVFKFEKFLTHYDEQAVFVHIVLGGKNNQYQVELRVKTPIFNLVVNKDGHDMYQLIDHVCRVMQERLEQEKQRMVDNRRQKKGCC